MHTAIRYKPTDHGHWAKTLAGNHGHLHKQRLRPRFTGTKNQTSTLGRAINNQEMLGISSFQCSLHDSQRIEDAHFTLHTTLECQNLPPQRQQQQHLSTIQNKVEPTKNAMASHDVASICGPRLAEMPTGSNILLRPCVSS